MDFYNKYSVKISEKFDIIARVIIMLTMILIVTNVVTRFFGYPINGAPELAGFLMASALAFAVSYCAALGGHVVLDILFDKLPLKLKVFVEIVANLLIFLFLLLIVRMLIFYGISLHEGGHVGLTTKVPLHYFAYLTAIGFSSYCLVIFGKLVEFVQRVSKR